MTTSRVPEDFHTITPHLVVRGVADAITWYARAFGANERARHELLVFDRRLFGDAFHVIQAELR